MTERKVTFDPLSREGRCRAGQSLLECARECGVGIISTCGGLGTCHSCKVRVTEGGVSPPTAKELATMSRREIAAGWRLACQAYPSGDCRVSVPPESLTALQRTQVEGVEVAVAPEPAVRAYRMKLDPPSISDLLADGERLLAALRGRDGPTEIDIEVLRGLSADLRSWGWECQSWVRGPEVIAVSPPGSARPLGLAVDLGTTKLAAYLVDLATGRTLAAGGAQNPQATYGADVVTRLSHAMRSAAARDTLQDLAVGAINGLASSLCDKAGATTGEIVDATVVANTAMHHLLLGLPVEQLARAPFVPAAAGALDVKARDLGLNFAPGTYVHLPPLIAGFVGSDHVAMLLASMSGWNAGLTIALDIGTNTEISLVDGRNIASTSCASGPAFEGGHLKHGMPAAAGAIERLLLTDGTVQYQTIDGAPPAGICGSGVLDALAQLYLAGVVDRRGHMSGDHKRLRTRAGQREFVLAPGDRQTGRRAIVLTQRDVRELQLAKGAIRAGIETLLRAGGRSAAELDTVIVAGAFGSYIDIGSAVAIGMLPPLPPDRIRQVGNAAGVGAKLMLVSLSKREEAKGIASRARYIELSSAPGFMKTFAQAGYLGPFEEKNGNR